MKDVLAEVVRVLKMEGDAILNSARNLESLSSESGRQIQRAIELIQYSLGNQGKIIITGVGKSGKIAEKIAATLSSTGSLAIFLHATEAYHGDLGVVRSVDVVLALSQTGNTDEVVRLVPYFKKMGIPIIGMGGNASSHLAALSDAWISTEVEFEACPNNLAPTTSTTLALAYGDALAIALMKLKGFGAADFAQFHPGGSLGKKLNLRVADLMHSGESVAWVVPEAAIDEVLFQSTTKKLGAVLVLEGKQLLGIITDGDIRRSLHHREKFFHLRASDIMTRKPISATPEMMAQSALELMENRPSQISVLPVVDEQGDWKGLIRLHDLVKAF